PVRVRRPPNSVFDYRTAAIIPPSMQFLLSLFYGEAFTPARAVSFSLIWLGLVFFSFDLFTQARRTRKAAVAAPAAS
ncbi:MAG: hypothetical protein AB7M12_13705, partial [Hyphomonadaceae bacterium]